MKRCWIRLILLLVVVFMQTGCCWSNCPEPWNSGFTKSGSLWLL